MNFIILISALTFSNLSMATNGKIVFSNGSIWINDSITKMGAPISFGDKIKTGAKTTSILKINPATTLKLKPNSEVIIEKPKTSSKFETHSYILKLGEMFIKASRTKKRTYQVKSNHVTFGVRGTQFFVSASKDNKNWMCVNEGIVSVKIKDQKKVIEVKAGQGVKISSNHIPKVRQYPWTKKLNWNMAGELSKIEDKVDLESLNYDIEELDYE